MKKVFMRTQVLALSIALGFSALLSSCSKEAMVPQNEEAMELPTKNGAPAPGSDPIAQIAIDAGFSELVGALVYVDGELNTGFVDLFMNGNDQYTVFAPTNEAFQNLYAALEVEGITDLSPELVRDVLLYHVVEGRRAANSVVPKKGVKNISTLLGVNFTVNPQLQITAVGNTASIVSPNISASNGIIHVIDAVILPIE